MVSSASPNQVLCPGIDGCAHQEDHHQNKRAANRVGRCSIRCKAKPYPDHRLADHRARAEELRNEPSGPSDDRNRNHQRENRDDSRYETPRGAAKRHVDQPLHVFVLPFVRQLSQFAAFLADLAR